MLNEPLLLDEERKAILLAITPELRGELAVNVIDWANKARVGEIMLAMILQGQLEIFELDGDEPRVRLTEAGRQSVGGEYDHN